MGKLLRWHSDKGFGFIQPDDGGDDVFVHASGLEGGEGSVRDGDPVEFVVEYDDRRNKDRAINVKLVGGGGGGGGGRGGRKDSRSPPPRRDSRRR
jgi:CspA family cold shock protein